MILADDLRKAVLQAAIQGKLVEQRPEEGTGEELYQQILAGKEKLIKEGKIKKERPLPEITEDVLPYEFPNNWKVCYVDDIAFVTKLAGFEYTSTIAPNLSTSGIPLFKGKNVQNGQLVLDFESYIPEAVSESLPRSQIRRRCLLTPYVGTIGNIAIFDGQFPAHLGSNVGKIELLNNDRQLILEEYVLYYLRSEIGYKELTKYKKATAQESISIDAIRNVIIAIPPLEEQKRIVEKLNCILAEIDEYSSAEQELTSLQSAFPDDMRKSILQYAMQGKLVEQRPKEGTGEELYQQIQAEKEKLIKEGKIKKEKSMPSITEDEIPFDIPDSWIWVRFNELGETTGTDSFCDGPFGSNLKTVHYIDKPEVRIIQLSNIGEYGWRDDNVKFTSYKHLEEVIPKCEVFPGNLVIAKMMPAGRTIEVPDLGTRITLGSDAMKFVPHHLINKQYLIWYMRSNAFLNQIYADVHGITRVRTSLQKIKTYLVPVPPLDEQKRIVDKLEQILPHIDDIKETI